MPIPAPKSNPFPGVKNGLDICRQPAKVPATIMKCETTNTILTFVLGALTLLSVVFALQTIFRTRELRSLQMAIPEQNYMMTVQLLYNDAVEYGKTHPDINRLLPTTQTAKPATR